jgi:hypothetical protein
MSAGTQQVSTEPGHRAPCPRAARRAAGYWPDGRCPPAEVGPQPLRRASTPRPPVADHPCTPAGCGSGHRPPADTARASDVAPERRPPGDAVRTAGGGRGAGVWSAAELDAASVRCPPLLSTPVSGRDTAAGCGCPLLQEPVARLAAAGGVPPPPGRAGELTLQPVAKLGAHPGHGRPLQGQGLLGAQPAESQAQQVAALPAVAGHAGAPPVARSGLQAPVTTA